MAVSQALRLEDVDDENVCGSEWLFLGQEPYRKLRLSSSPQWEQLADGLVNGMTCCASSAGPICVIPGQEGWGSLKEKDGKLVSFVYFFTCTGKWLAKCSFRAHPLDPSNRIKAAGFLQDESCLLLYEDGTLGRIRQEYPVVSIIGSIAFILQQQNGYIQSAIILTRDACIVQTTNDTFYLFQDVLRSKSPLIYHRFCVDDSKTRKNISVSSYQVYPNINHSVNEIQLLVGYQDGSIILSNMMHYQIIYQLGEEYVSQMSISPDGRFIAAMTCPNQSLWVWNADMTKVFLQRWQPFQSSSTTTMKQMAWCGNDCIVIQYSSWHILMVGPQGEYVSILEEPLNDCILFTEMDGLRLMSKQRVHFIQKVSSSFYEWRRMGSTDDVVLLATTFSSMQTNKKESRIRFFHLLEYFFTQQRLLDILQVVLQTIIWEEWHVKRQKSLLKLVSFCLAYQGSHRFHPQVTILANQLTMVCRTLRLLYCIRHVAGIPLTFVQLQALDGDKLMDRISRYGFQEMAFHLAIFMGVDPTMALIRWANQQLVNWAQQSTRTSNTVHNNEMNKMLLKEENPQEWQHTEEKQWIERLTTQLENIAEEYQIAAPFTDISLTAWRLHLPTIAVYLTQKEQRIHKKVPLLLMQEKDLEALKAAAQDGDPELGQGVFIRLRQRLTSSQMIDCFQSLKDEQYKEAIQLYATFLKRYASFEEWNEFVLAMEWKPSMTILAHAHLSFQKTKQRKKALDWLVLTMNRIAKKVPWLIWSLKMESKMLELAKDVERNCKLTQGTLQVASVSSFIRSTAQHITALASISERRECLYRIKNQLKVPDRRFFYQCLQGMALNNDFEDMFIMFGNEKHPPSIGWMPFIEVCVRHGRVHEAYQFAQMIKVQDPQERALALAKAGYGKEAAELASRLKNTRLLEQIYEWVQ
eukprot:jgi/Galph1/2596/GphlegSOOS_G1272.1